MFEKKQSSQLMLSLSSCGKLTLPLLWPFILPLKCSFNWALMLCNNKHWITSVVKQQSSRKSSGCREVILKSLFTQNCFCLCRFGCLGFASLCVKCLFCFKSEFVWVRFYDMRTNFRNQRRSNMKLTEMWKLEAASIQTLRMIFSVKYETSNVQSLVHLNYIIIK